MQWCRGGSRRKCLKPLKENHRWATFSGNRRNAGFGPEPGMADVTHRRKHAGLPSRITFVVSQLSYQRPILLRPTRGGPGRSQQQHLVEISTTTPHHTFASAGVRKHDLGSCNRWRRYFLFNLLQEKRAIWVRTNEPDRSNSSRYCSTLWQGSHRRDVLGEDNECAS